MCFTVAASCSLLCKLAENISNSEKCSIKRQFMPAGFDDTHQLIKAAILQRPASRQASSPGGQAGKRTDGQAGRQIISNENTCVAAYPVIISLLFRFLYPYSYHTHAHPTIHTDTQTHTHTHRERERERDRDRDRER